MGVKEKQFSRAERQIFMPLLPGEYDFLQGLLDLTRHSPKDTRGRQIESRRAAVVE
jgi:hypothetical protein